MSATNNAVNSENGEALPIEATMTAILATLFAILVGLHSIQLPNTSKTPESPNTSKNNTPKRSIPIPMLLPDPQTEPSKYHYELFCSVYSVIWISTFGFIVVSGCYESFTEWTYLWVCGGLALPLVLQPLVYPQAFPSSIASNIATFMNPSKNHNQNHSNIDVPSNPDVLRPLFQRYSTKINIYLLTYSFIGNYWYTHYFYSVLKARYSMPSHRMNDVPIAMFLATIFYFNMYHNCLSNGLLRFVDRSYASNNGGRKTVLFWSTVFTLSYFTAFMETLTISSFPYYSFQDRIMAYKYGSAFYGIYFIVSFPGFYNLDGGLDGDAAGTQVRQVGRQNGINDTNDRTKNGDHNEIHHQQQNQPLSLWDTFVTACGHGLMILTLLDFVRLYLGIPLTIGGVAFAVTHS